jgi:hypothetical protein
MITDAYQWLVDHALISLLAGIGISFAIGSVRHRGRQVAAIISLAAVPLALMLATGIEAGCVLGSARGEPCMGSSFGLTLTIVWVTPIWIASIGLGLFLRLIQSKR